MVDENQLGGQQIAQMMLNEDIQGLGKAVHTLMKLPQSHCKTRGDCCRVATFKGSLGFEELQALAASGGDDATNAQEFLTLFEPYASQDDVRKVAPEFVDRVREKMNNDEADKIGFFKCRFVGESGLCQIHEDRPVGCRVYPFPHSSMVYHPGCGFEEIGTRNAQLIQLIQRYFDEKLAQLNQETQALDDQRQDLQNH